MMLKKSFTLLNKLYLVSEINFSYDVQLVLFAKTFFFVSIFSFRSRQKYGMGDKRGCSPTIVLGRL